MSKDLPVHATMPHIIRNPVWKDGPLMCDYEMLPAFATEQDALNFHNLHGENPTAIYEKWKCEVCGHWHYLC
jgi:hypothetical protein